MSINNTARPHTAISNSTDMDAFTIRAISMLGLLMGITLASRHEEPICTSRFDFEEKLLEKLVRLEHAMESLQARVTHELTAIEDASSNLKQESASFKESTRHELAEALANLKRSGEELKEDKVKLVAEVDTMAQQYEAKLTRMSKDVLEAINKSSSAERIVFAVQGATERLVGGVPTFEKADVNVGNAYDVNTGKFTCTETGLYVFGLSLRSTTSSYVYCYITKNGSNINYALTDGSYDMASVAVFVRLVVGDVVELNSCSNWELAKFDKNGASFFGVKL